MLKYIFSALINCLLAINSGLYGQNVALSVVKIEILDISENVLGSGSGFVLHKEGNLGYIITAHHVTQHGNLRIRYYNGEVSIRNIEIYGNAKQDIAILLCWVPDCIPALEIGEMPTRGDCLEIWGYGTPETDKLKCSPLRFSLHNNDIFYSDGFVTPGYSGGPLIFKSKVIGVVSKGILILPKPTHKELWPAVSNSIINLKLDEIVPAKK